MATVKVPARPGFAEASQRRRVLPLYLLLGLLAMFALLAQVRFTYDQALYILHGSPPIPRAPFLMNGYPPRIYILQKEAQAGGLRIGDQVVALNGVKLRGVNTITRIVNGAKPGDRLVAEGIRDGQTVAATLRLEAPNHSNYFVELALGLILAIFMPWFSLFVGFYVAAVRLRDPLAWIVFGLLVSFSQLIFEDMSRWAAWIRIPSEIFHFASLSVWPLFMFLFGYYFPQAPQWNRRFPSSKWIVTALFILMAGVNTIAAVGMSESMERFGPFNAARSHFSKLESIIVFGVISAGITLLAQKSFYRKLTADAGRRLRLLFAGLILSLTPILILSIVLAFFRHTMEEIPDYVAVPALLLLLLFPLTLAYVIVVDRAMDVRVVIRQGLQYAFARSGLVVLRVLLVMLATWVAYAVSTRLQGNVFGIVLLCGLGLALAAFMKVGFRRLAIWIDRRFFREAYNAELVLSELSEQVRTIRETQALVEIVCASIAKTLHLARISVLLESGGCFRTCHSTGFEHHNEQVDFAEDSAVIAYLQQAEEPPRVYFDDKSSWLYRTPGLDDEQRSRLAYLGAELLLPLSTRDKLLGFIAAGQKRSEEPYSKSDIRILSSVASQTGLALENAQLTTAIASEMAQRERLAREVEIAREVQERLFPQKLPFVPGLDYSGMCRTALGVGGDYYDFLSLPGSQFGFAVADVAGKGISAALLMASLQASLRGEAGQGGDRLSQMMVNLNERVYESSSSNRYATFFYGQYTPSSRELKYVNAGHNPPLLLRRDGEDWAITILEATGTVVGLIASATYEQASLPMHPGDYLILFTDGISEAMNYEDQEWGEECLCEAARACVKSSLPAAETVRRILSAADAFVNGAKQRDDMTIVVLRVI